MRILDLGLGVRAMPLESGQILFPSARNKCGPEKVAALGAPPLAFARY